MHTMLRNPKIKCCHNNNNNNLTPLAINGIQNIIGTNNTYLEVTINAKIMSFKSIKGQIFYVDL